MSQTPEQAREALLFLISLQEQNGTLAPEIAAIARECVEVIYRSKSPTDDALKDAIDQGLPIGVDGETRICPWCGHVVSLEAHREQCPWPRLVEGVPG